MRETAGNSDRRFRPMKPGAKPKSTNGYCVAEIGWRARRRREPIAGAGIAAVGCIRVRACACEGDGGSRCRSTGSWRRFGRRPSLRWPNIGMRCAARGRCRLGETSTRTRSVVNLPIVWAWALRSRGRGLIGRLAGQAVIEAIGRPDPRAPDRRMLCRGESFAGDPRAVRSRGQRSPVDAQCRAGLRHEAGGMVRGERISMPLADDGKPLRRHLRRDRLCHRRREPGQQGRPRRRGRRGRVLRKSSLDNLRCAGGSRGAATSLFASRGRAYLLLQFRPGGSACSASCRSERRSSLIAMASSWNPVRYRIFRVPRRDLAISGEVEAVQGRAS